MKTMKIFEPAMCCPTGLCGVGVDPELLRISTVLNTLKQSGVEVERYNLTSAPQVFVQSKPVTEFLQKFGPDKLPVVLVDDFIVIAGRYPTNDEFTSWLELPCDALGSACCEGESCCCGDAAPSEENSCCCGDAPASEDSSCCCGDAPASEENSCCCGDEASSDCCCSGDAPASDCCCGDGCC